ncbi:hypothetical protein Hte_009624 [Hypoxylon texense]
MSSEDVPNVDLITRLGAPELNRYIHDMTDVAATEDQIAPSVMAKYLVQLRSRVETLEREAKDDKERIREAEEKLGDGERDVTRKLLSLEKSREELDSFRIALQERADANGSIRELAQKVANVDSILVNCASSLQLQDLKDGLERQRNEDMEWLQQTEVGLEKGHQAIGDMKEDITASLTELHQKLQDYDPAAIHQRIGASEASIGSVVTKALTDMPTKEDLANMPSKEDLANMPSKDDLTIVKQDLSHAAVEGRAAHDAKIDSLAEGMSRLTLSAYSAQVVASEIQGALSPTGRLGEIQRAVGYSQGVLQEYTSDSGRARVYEDLAGCVWQKTKVAFDELSAAMARLDEEQKRGGEEARRISLNLNESRTENANVALQIADFIEEAARGIRAHAQALSGDAGRESQRAEQRLKIRMDSLDEKAEKRSSKQLEELAKQGKDLKARLDSQDERAAQLSKDLAGEIAGKIGSIDSLNDEHSQVLVRSLQECDKRNGQRAESLYGKLKQHMDTLDKKAEDRKGSMMNYLLPTDEIVVSWDQDDNLIKKIARHVEWSQETLKNDLLERLDSRFQSWDDKREAFEHMQAKVRQLTEEKLQVSESHQKLRDDFEEKISSLQRQNAKITLERDTFERRLSSAAAAPPGVSETQVRKRPRPSVWFEHVQNATALLQSADVRLDNSNVPGGDKKLRTHKTMIRLLDLLDQHQAPSGAVQNVSDFLRDAHQDRWYCLEDVIVKGQWRPLEHPAPGDCGKHVKCFQALKRSDTPAGDTPILVIRIHNNTHVPSA